VIALAGDDGWDEAHHVELARQHVGLGGREFAESEAVEAQRIVRGGCHDVQLLIQ
jgi:hypothetical protein